MTANSNCKISIHAAAAKKVRLKAAAAILVLLASALMSCTPPRIIHPGEHERADAEQDQAELQDGIRPLFQLMYFAWAENSDYQAVMGDLDELASSPHDPLADLRVVYVSGEQASHSALSSGLTRRVPGGWEKWDDESWTPGGTVEQSFSSAVQWTEESPDEHRIPKVLVIAGESGPPYKGVLYDEGRGDYLDYPAFARILSQMTHSFDLICLDSGFSSSLELSYELFRMHRNNGTAPPMILASPGLFSLEGRDYSKVSSSLVDTLSVMNLSDIPAAEAVNRQVSAMAAVLGTEYAYPGEGGTASPYGQVVIQVSAWEQLMPVLQRIWKEIYVRLDESGGRDAYRNSLFSEHGAGLWYTTPGDMRISAEKILGQGADALFSDDAQLLHRLRGDLRSALKMLVPATYPVTVPEPGEGGEGSELNSELYPVHLLLSPLFSNGTADPRFPIEYSGEYSGSCTRRLAFCRDGNWAPGTQPSVLERLWFDLIE